MSIEDDKIIQVLELDEAKEVHQFNVRLGSDNEGFYRWYEDEDYLDERDGLTYHYVEYNDRNYRVEYQKTPEGRYVFTGNVVEIDTTGKDMLFDDGDF